MEVFARSWHANRKKLPLPHPAQDQPHDGRAVKEGLFYVRRHTCGDGWFEWYVLNGLTRRPASKLFRTRAAAAAERARLQVKLELAKEQVPQILHQPHRSYNPHGTQNPATGGTGGRGS